MGTGGRAAIPAPRSRQRWSEPVNKPKSLKATVILAIAIAGTLAVSACNTVEGVGKDVKAGGAAVEDTAKDAKN
jgi:entericidin B